MMTMATFRKRATGWEYRITWRDSLTGKQKEKSGRGFATKAEAKEKANDVEHDLRSGYVTDDNDNISLKAYLHVWLDEYKSGMVRKNTLAIQKRNVDGRIIPYFKELKLKSLTPILYQKFLNELATKYSKRTVEMVHATMISSLDKAVQLKILKENPCRGASVKGIEKQDIGLQFIQTPDIPVFLQAARKYGYIYWMFFKVLIETGLRKGEAAALQWPDINFKEQTLTVSKSLDFQAKEGEPLFGDTKTYASKRTIKLSNSLVSDLKLHLTWQNANKLSISDLYKHDLNLVLCREDGDFMPKSSLFNAFQRILNHAGLPKIPIHALRHTHAVLLLESGVEMKFIQERLGHKTYQMTADIYSHVSKKIEETSMQKFESYIRSENVWD
jgi:integrase